MTGPSPAPGRKPAWWWWPHGDAPRQRAVLFFGPSGAEPTAARPLIAPAAGLRFGVLQLPGRGPRHAEPAPVDLPPLLDAIAATIVSLGGPPPVLVGHSFGGLLAYGVAARLEDCGTSVGRLIPVASASPTHWTRQLATDRDRYGDESLDRFVRRRTGQILGHGGVPAQVLRHPELATRARELIAVDVALSRHGFVPRALTTAVTALVASGDTVLADGAADGWADVAAGSYTRRDVPGGHFFYRAEPRGMMAQVRLEVQALDGEFEWM